MLNVFTGTPLQTFVDSFSLLHRKYKGHHADYEDHSVLLFSTLNLKKKQSLVFRAENFKMDERVGLFVLLDLIATVYRFGAGYSVSSKDQLEFTKEFILNKAKYSSILKPIEHMTFMMKFSHSDLDSLFVGERWASKNIIDLPEPEGSPGLKAEYDFQDDVFNNFCSFEQNINRWNRRRDNLTIRLDRERTIDIEDSLLVMCVTWNVQGFLPRSYRDINNLFEPILESRPHIVAVGLEEVFECKAHNVSKMLTSSTESEEHVRWKNCLEACLKKIDLTYHIVGFEINGPLFLCVFSNIEKRDIVATSFSKVNLGSLGTSSKGAITFNIKIRNCKLQFVVCHLESGESSTKNNQRITQLHTILPSIIEDDSKGYQVKKKVRGAYEARPAQVRPRHGLKLLLIRSRHRRACARRKVGRALRVRRHELPRRPPLPRVDADHQRHQAAEAGRRRAREGDGEAARGRPAGQGPERSPHFEDGQREEGDFHADLQTRGNARLVRARQRTHAFLD